MITQSENTRGDANVLDRLAAAGSDEWGPYAAGDNDGRGCVFPDDYEG